MATQVRYGNVVLHNVLTRTWEERVIYDPSNTDIVRHEYRMTFEGLLYLGQQDTGTVPVWTAVVTTGGIPTSTLYSAIRSHMLQARQEFSVWVGDYDEADNRFFYCTASTKLADPDRDVNNGPRPIAFDILQLIGSRVARVAFTIECSKVDCLLAHNRSSVPWILNARWSVEEAMDQNAQMTRTFDGRIVLSAPVMLAPDPRLRVTPPLEAGFRRDSVTFTATENGLECRYRVVDRQVYAAAPWPATEIELSRTEEMTSAAKHESEVTARLVAPVNAPRDLLLVRLIQVLDARVKFIEQAQPEARKGAYLIDYRITEHFGEQCVVEGSLRLWHNVGASVMRSVADWVRTMRDPLRLADGTLPRYDQRISRVPAPYGYDVLGKERRPAVWLTLQCLLQQPCDDAHGFLASPPQNPPPIKEPPTAPPQLLESPGDASSSLPQMPSDADQSLLSRIYTLCRLNNRYITEGGRVQLPLAPDYTSSAEPEKTCAFVTLGLSTTRRILEFDSECSNDWPEIPVPRERYQDGPIHAVLLRAEIQPQPPALEVDQLSRFYRVSGRYEWALSRPPRNDEKLDTGVLAYTRYTPDETRFDPQKAYSTRIGPRNSEIS